MQKHQKTCVLFFSYFGFPGKALSWINPARASMGRQGSDSNDGRNPNCARRAMRTEWGFLKIALKVTGSLFDILLPSNAEFRRPVEHITEFLSRCGQWEDHFPPLPLLLLSVSTSLALLNNTCSLQRRVHCKSSTCSASMGIDIHLTYVVLWPSSITSLGDLH